LCSIEICQKPFILTMFCLCKVFRTLSTDTEEKSAITTEDQDKLASTSNGEIETTNDMKGETTTETPEENGYKIKLYL